MAVTTKDVLTETVVGATLEERTEDKYQFRRAFRDHDATSINSDSFTFPTRGDELDESDFQEVAELAEYPTAALSFDGETVRYAKYGFKVPVSDEAADDSRLSLALDRLEDMGRSHEAKVDKLAYGFLAANQSGEGPVSSADGDFETVVDAYTALVDAGYDPGRFELYLSAAAWGQLAKDDVLNRATDDGDALARNGQLGEVMGVPTLLSNTGDLGADDGLLVDTGKYGYLSTRWGFDVSTYRNEAEFPDADIYKIRRRFGFAITDANAALSLDFSGA